MEGPEAAQEELAGGLGAQQKGEHMPPWESHVDTIGSSAHSRGFVRTGGNTKAGTWPVEAFNTHLLLHS